MPLAPTVELIESQAIVEGREYEFKQQVDFDQAQQKSNFIDDVVAFLNSEISGHIVIGVKEKGGAFAGYSPLLADPDHLCRRVTSIIQDGVEPRPLGVDVRAIAIPGGSILDVAIAQHPAGPYQNRANGAFYVRTGAKNTPLRRDELAAYFVTRERYEADLGTRLAREQADLDASETMATPGAVLDIAILPREHYDRDLPPFEPGQGILKAAPAFHWDRRQPFKGCERGHQAIEQDGHQKGIGRILIGDDWFIHAQVVHPLDIDGSGRVMIHEFKDELTAFLSSLEVFLADESLKGPFCVHLGLRRLQSAERIGWVFPHADAVSLPRPAWTERVAAPAIIDLFHRRLTSVSRYG